MGSDDYFIINRMPLKVFKLSCLQRSRGCREDFEILQIESIVPINTHIIMIYAV